MEQKNFSRAQLHAVLEDAHDELMEWTTIKRLSKSTHKPEDIIIEALNLAIGLGWIVRRNSYFKWKKCEV